MIDELKRTISIIRNNKFLFLILVVIQLLVVITFSLITAKFQLLLLEDINDTLKPLQNANYDPQKVDAGQPFLEEIVPLLQGYASMKAHFMDFMLWVTFFLLIVNGVLWLGSYYMINKYNVKQVLKQWLNYLVAVIISSIILWLVGLLLFKSLFNSTVSLESALTLLGVAGFIIYYLISVAFAHLNEHSVKNFGIVSWNHWRYIYKTFPYFLINALVLGLFVYGIYLTSLVKENFNLMIVLMVLAMLLLVVARLFWIVGLTESYSKFLKHSTV